MSIFGGIRRGLYTPDVASLSEVVCASAMEAGGKNKVYHGHTKPGCWNFISVLPSKCISVSRRLEAQLHILSWAQKCITVE